MVGGEGPLYNKYRPTSFDEIVGQDTQVQIVKDALKSGSRTFLFFGDGGCGKSALANVIAHEVHAGELSVHKINSSDNRGIDTARELIQQSRYQSPDGTTSVWILEEAHSWTTAMQESMLDLLENVPENNIFILTTTEPEKLKAPLKSRCTIVNMKPISDEDMLLLLRKISKAEGKKFSVDVFEAIIKKAEGRSRKALTILGKILLTEDEEKQLEIIENDEGEGAKDAIELARILFKGAKWAQVAEVLKSIDLSNVEGCRQLLMGYANSILLKQMNIRAVKLFEAAYEADTYRNGKNAITMICLKLAD
jgi:DNA polymerase III gamma/tau subunit